MKKAVLSNRIYMNFDEELYNKCKEELTYKIPAKIPTDPPIIKRLYTIVNKSILTIPIGRIDLIPKDYEIVDKRTINPVKFPAFKFKLRDSQQEVYDKFDDNCLINANVSWGKTFTGIALAHKMGQKTLVITHTVNLRDQWVEEVKHTMGIAPGIIGGGKLDYKNKPITIANIQTLRKHINELKDEFGMVILDEVHHCPAKMFEETLNTLKARYKVGLSATLRRKDHLHVVITDYFGHKIFRPPAENQMKPVIYMIKTDIPFSSSNSIPWANKVNELCARKEYIDLVVRLSASFADKGHKVLMVSDRTEFLETCGNILADRSVVVHGKTKNRDELHQLLEKDEKDILNGAISIYKEGISLNWLSCLILGAPTNNEPLLEQLIGRVIRKHPNKPTPVIVDIVLKGHTASKQAKTRAGVYMQAGYTIHYIDLT